MTKQTSTEDTDAVTNIPESPKQDTSNTLRHLSQVCADADEKCQQRMTSEGVQQYTDAQQEDDEHSVEKVTQERLLQCSPNSHAQHSFVLMRSSCPLKR